MQKIVVSIFAIVLIAFGVYFNAPKKAEPVKESSKVIAVEE